jgi:hypothetical protein
LRAIAPSLTRLKLGAEVFEAFGLGLVVALQAREYCGYDFVSASNRLDSYW